MMATSGGKYCSSCKELLPHTAFNRNGSRRANGVLRQPDGLQNCCKDCHQSISHQSYLKRKANDPAWYEQAKEASKERGFRKRLQRHGLSADDYELLAAKGCAICGGPSNGHGRYHFDHCHITGQFRGLLCHYCNVGLGQFREDETLLLKAIKYVRYHNTRLGLLTGPVREPDRDSE